MCDMREKSEFSSRPSIGIDICGKNPKLSSNIYSKWVNAISAAKFSSNPNHLFSRDYLTVKMWDIRAASSSTTVLHKPVYSAQVTDYMERNLPTLLDNDSLEDQFFLDVSPDGKYLATGAYNKCGHVIDLNATTNTVVNTIFGAERDSPAGKLKTYGKAKRLNTATAVSGIESKVDLKKRALLGCWAPASP